MLSRLWAAVSGWFLSRKPGEDAVSPAETSQQAKVAKQPLQEPAIEKLPQEAAASKQKEVGAFASSLPPPPPDKVAKQPLPEPAIERLPKEAAASKQKEVEASASSLPPGPPDKVAKQSLPEPAIETLPKEAPAAKQKEVEASASSLPPPPARVAKRPLPEPAIEKLPKEAASASSFPPQPPAKVAKQPLPEPAIERLPKEAAASKQKEVEASASSLPPQPPAKVARESRPEPAIERLPKEAGASKQKEVEASASSLPPQPPAKVAHQPLPEPAIERLPKEAGASKQKQVEASPSLPEQPPAKVAKQAHHESAAERLRKELFAKRTGTDSSNFSASSDNYRSRMEELKQNLKDKQDELAASGSNDSRGQAFISFSVTRDGQKERARAQEDAGPLNIFSEVSELDQGTIPKRRAVLKPPRAKTPEPESHESEDDSPWLSDQSASEHSFELRDWRLLDQPIQTFEMPEAKPAKKRKRGKKKKKPGRLEEGERFTAASQKRTESQEGRADQVDPSQFGRQQSLDEGKDENSDAKKRKKKRKKDKKEKIEEKDKQFHDEALNEVEDSALLEREHQGEEEHAILSVSSGEEEHHEDHGVVECKFVAENDAALGLRRRIERHKTRALEEARKEEKKARKKAGKAAEKALKALRKAEKAEAKAEGFGFANKKQKTDASRTSQEAEWTALRELSKTCGQFQDEV